MAEATPEETKTVAKRFTQSYVDEAFKQILLKPDVTDVLVLNTQENPIKSTMTEENSVQHAGMFGSLLQKTRYILNLLDPLDEVFTVRVRTKFHETLMTPDNNVTYIVIQKPIDRIQT